MKKVLVLLMIVPLLFSCKKNKKLSYKQLKTGTFLVENDDDVIIIRNDSLQLETYKSTHQIDSFSITWKNDSTYVLTMLKPKTAIDLDSIIYKIKKLDKNGYQFESTIKGSSYAQKGRIFKK